MCLIQKEERNDIVCHNVRDEYIVIVFRKCFFLGSFNLNKGGLTCFYAKFVFDCLSPDKYHRKMNFGDNTEAKSRK